jgi:hypothetical protein
VGNVVQEKCINLLAKSLLSIWHDRGLMTMLEHYVDQVHGFTNSKVVSVDMGEELVLCSFKHL